MTEDEAKDILSELLPLSYEFNEIFWGKGLDTLSAENNEIYAKVDEKYGYTSADDILTAASEVFSSEYLEIIKSAVFDGNEEEGINPRYMDIGGVLKADTSNKGFDIKGNIETDSVKIKRQNSKVVTLTADYADGGSTVIQLVNENGVWKLNSATY